MKNLLSYFSFVIFLLFLSVKSTYAQKHWVYVAAESEDEVSLVTFDAEAHKGSVAEVIRVGQFPTEIEGPHGINISPDGDHWFLSVAHGNPYGWLYKFSTQDNQLIQRTELGMFPASMEVSTATGLLYVVNFNLHGDKEPGTVSVIDPEAMKVVGEIKTGIMPHGSRISSDGRRQYHVSMMTDELIEINTLSMEIFRRLDVAPNNTESNKNGIEPIAKPTWADPHPNKPYVYVCNNGSNEIVEVDTKDWQITRRFNTGKAPYNLEVSHDGKLLAVTYKGEGATGVWNLRQGKEMARISNSRLVPHGVSISPDNQFAFISVEGKRGEPGSVDVINLQNPALVEVIEVGKQAGGVIHWKTTGTE